ncbi:hypothetical protein D3C76_1019780 [compost metagenome]
MGKQVDRTGRAEGLAFLCVDVIDMQAGHRHRQGATGHAQLAGLDTFDGAHEALAACSGQRAQLPIAVQFDGASLQERLVREFNVFERGHGIVQVHPRFVAQCSNTNTGVRHVARVQRHKKRQDTDELVVDHQARHYHCNLGQGAMRAVWHELVGLAAGRIKHEYLSLGAIACFCFQ